MYAIYNLQIELNFKQYITQNLEYYGYVVVSLNHINRILHVYLTEIIGFYFNGPINFEITMFDEAYLNDVQVLTLHLTLLNQLVSSEL